MAAKVHLSLSERGRSTEERRIIGSALSGPRATHEGAASARGGANALATGRLLGNLEISLTVTSAGDESV